MSNISLCYVQVRRSFNVYRYSLNPRWSLREHISRARPTEMIFHLLRSIPSECLLDVYPVDMGLDILEVIIKWLQVSVSEWNRRILQAKNHICVY